MEDTFNVYLVKDGTLFLLHVRNDFEKMTSRRYGYVKGLNGHSEIALYVDIFDELVNGQERVGSMALHFFGSGALIYVYG